MKDLETISFIAKIELANERFRLMSLNDCIMMWNNSACDHYCRFMEMHEMSDLEWWDTLSKELGAWDLLNVVLNSTEHFNNSDMFFFYDQDNGQMISFNTKQELIGIIGDDFFIETMLDD